MWTSRNWSRRPSSPEGRLKRGGCRGDRVWQKPSAGAYRVAGLVRGKSFAVFKNRSLGASSSVPVLAPRRAGENVGALSAPGTPLMRNVPNNVHRTEITLSACTCFPGYLSLYLQLTKYNVLPVSLIYLNPQA